jgi:predicted secreted protein
MATDARIGHGTQFQMLDGSVYTTVGEITTITPPALARDAVDATHTESPDGWREFIPGLKDAGEFSFEMNFEPGSTGTALILSTFSASTPASCRLVFPDATIWAFDAYCTGFAPAAPLDDKMTATATFKLTGKPGFIT